MLIEEVNLDQRDRALPFSAAEAAEAVRSEGIFQFQVMASELEQAQHALLNNYRLKFTLPLFSEPPDGFALLGTGTLFEHEDRYFIVTADHIFRTDQDDPHSALIDMTTVGVPTDPRPAGAGAAPIVTLGNHIVYRLTLPVLIDVIVVELLGPKTIATLKAGWSFLPFSQAEDVAAADDRFVITGFMAQGLKFDPDTKKVGQAMLNLETDYLHYTPEVKHPVPKFDLFFYLQSDMTNVDGTQRTVTTLKGLSGGPIWAVRDISKDEVWMPSRAMKIVAIQSSELQSREKWSRGFRWSAVQQILRQPDVGLEHPP
ncbi:hypothetical protein LB529_13385 [Mesorhizobium sp. CA5]|nr:hypothetical protein [Mesorhizobium sp. CA5]